MTLLTHAQAQSWIEWLSPLLIASALLIILSRRLPVSIELLGVQSIILAVVAGLVAGSTGLIHFYVVALLTLALKGVAIPRILRGITTRIGVEREQDLPLPMKASTVIALGLIVLGYHLTPSFALRGSGLSANGLPIALSLVLLGMFIMVSRQKALMQIIGLLTMENGLYLAALTATYGMPLVVELGVFFDVFVLVLIMGVLVYRINQTFDTINTDALRELKG